MNKDIAILREVVVKLTPLLAGRGMRVTQQGSGAFVERDRSGNAIRVNIPHLPDDASAALVTAIQGFLDHEVAHILFTDGPLRVRRTLANPKIESTWNFVEDTYIERKMSQRFAGSGYNLDRVGEFVLTELTEPQLKKLKPHEPAAFNFLMLPMIRALAGQSVFQRWMDDNDGWSHPLVADFVRQFKPHVSKLQTADSTNDCFDVAEIIYAIMHPPAPPSPPAPAPSKEPEQTAAEPDDGDNDEQEQPSDDEKGEPSDGEGSNEDKPEDEDDKGSGGEEADENEEDEESQPESGAPADQDESEDESDNGDSAEAESEGEAEDETPDRDEAGSGSDDEDEGNERDGDSGRDGDADDTDSKPAGADDADDADDEDGDSGDVGGTNDDSDGEDEDEGEDGDAAAGADQAAEGEPSEAEEEPDNAHGAGPSLFQEVEVDIDDQSLAEAISQVIVAEASRQIRGAEYRVFTTDYDRIKTYEVNSGTYKDVMLRNLDDKVSHMIGPMQKDIERMMASRSRAVQTPGHRSGKLHGAGLYKLMANDDRVFRRQQEAKAKKTAVCLLIDNSGSMSGSKMQTAMQAGYALSQTLERVGMKNEVLGFTNFQHPQYPVKEMRAEAVRIGRGFSRVMALNMPIYKGYDERLNSVVRSRFAHAASRHPSIDLCSNVDGESLQVAARRLAQRPEERKVLIVLSDGQPAADPSDWTCHADAISHLHDVVAATEKQRIEVIGIGINSTAVASFYPKHVVINNVEDLPGVVMNELKRVLLK